MKKTQVEFSRVAKLLKHVTRNPRLFQEKELNFIVGLTATEINNIKKYSFEIGFLERKKQDVIVTEQGMAFASAHFNKSWVSEDFPKRPEINLEYLKLDKAPPTLTKAIRCLARHLIEGEELKENSTEHYLIKELLCSRSVSAFSYGSQVH